MTRRNKTYYIIFLIILWLPLLNIFIFPKMIKPLKGAVILATEPTFNIHGWMKSTYQDSLDKFINDNIGIRPEFVRIHNQLKYSLFDEANAYGVIEGKNNYLYELSYIDSYNGDNFIGSSKLNDKKNRLQLINDSLKSKNITLLICLAAGKGTFYNEYFPKEYTKRPTDSTNYKVFAQLLKGSNINYIDFNSWFIKIKDTCDCMLYPKYGIHWSHYGMLLAADSIAGYISKIRNTPITRIRFTEIERSSQLKHTDYDIAEGMNLMFQMSSPKMCYPKYKLQPIIDKKLKSKVISDSFFWGMFNEGYNDKILAEGGFWYYNKEIFPDSFDDPTYVKDIHIKEEVEKSDVIIIMSTESNIHNIGWGFIDTLSNKYGYKN